jgi:alkylated DNA repair dioxygenase AlkB
MARGSPLHGQRGLFDVEPPGLVHVADFISASEETALLANLRPLPFQPFAFHGWFGKRETVSFGWRYDFNDSRVHAAPAIPEFLLPLRTRAATFAGLPPGALEQALVVRYDVGPESAGIAIDPSSTRSLASRCCRRASCASAGERDMDSGASHWMRRRAPPIC